MAIWMMLCRDLAKIVTRTARYQGKTACGNLKMCAGLKVGIEGVTHAVRQRQIERDVHRSREEEAMRE